MWWGSMLAKKGSHYLFVLKTVSDIMHMTFLSWIYTTSVWAFPAHIGAQYSAVEKTRDNEEVRSTLVAAPKVVPAY